MHGWPMGALLESLDPVVGLHYWLLWEAGRRGPQQCNHPVALVGSFTTDDKSCGAIVMTFSYGVWAD